MSSVRGANYADPPIQVRLLAQFAGLTGTVSVRQLLELLGDRQFGPNPLYIIGHNTNSIPEVDIALKAGANAVEVDVTAYESDLSQLCIDHAGVTGDSPGRPGAPRFRDFLRGLRQVADTRKEKLALVIFDCKPPAATPTHGRTMLDAIRDILTGDTGLNVIISVANVTADNPYRPQGTSIFDQIRTGLGAREGFMIDEQDDPDGVAAFFKKLGVTRFCYGNGTSFPLADEGTMGYRTPIEQACWMRVTRGGPRFVYAWTVNNMGNQQLYLRIGVNGILADPEGIKHFAEILEIPEFKARYRKATRPDNPFLPPNAAYGLTVRTSDINMAGTDANVTFTVTGANGASSTTVDTNYNNRMERGLVNYVVLPSPDLGELRAVTVRRDNRGNAPDWHLASIRVESLRYHSDKSASFNCWIDSTAPFTRPLS